jgi:hypothetical protein
LHNLIGDAVKPHKKDARPEVHMGVEHADGEWTFSVRDNDIVLTRGNSSASLGSFSGCTAGRSTKAPASAWRCVKRSSSATAGASGPNQNRARARRSTLQCQTEAQAHRERGGSLE